MLLAFLLPSERKEKKNHLSMGLVSPVGAVQGTVSVATLPTFSFDVSATAWWL